MQYRAAPLDAHFLDLVILDWALPFTLYIARVLVRPRAADSASQSQGRIPVFRRSARNPAGLSCSIEWTRQVASNILHLQHQLTAPKLEHNVRIVPFFFHLIIRGSAVEKHVADR